MTAAPTKLEEELRAGLEPWGWFNKHDAVTRYGAAKWREIGHELKPLYTEENILTLLDTIASLRTRLETAEALAEARREALEPFVAAFEKRRDAYSKRYKDRDLGFANFDKMPDHWPMEAIVFSMKHFRRARTLTKEPNNVG